MKRPLFSLDKIFATHVLPQFSDVDNLDKWQSNEDHVLIVPGTEECFEVTGCLSYTKAQLDRLGVPLRFLFERPFTARDTSYSAIIVNDATIVGDTGVVLDRNGAIVLESLFPPDRARPFEAIKAMPEFATCEGSAAFDEDVFIMFRGGGFNNYWHFHVDLLPIVTFVRKQGLENHFKMAVPTLKAWQREALERLSVPAERVIEVAGRVTRFRRCVLFSTMYSPEVTLPNSLARSTFQHLHDSVAATRDRQRLETNLKGRSFIYIARTDGLSRLLLNEQKLIEALRAMDFEIIVPSHLAYSEQLDAFSRASLIVGAHGAGLTNIFASDQHAVIVEIFPFGLLTAPHYFFLAKSLCLDYEMYISSVKSHVSPHENWALDIESFLLRLILTIDDRGLVQKDYMIRKLLALPDSKSLDFSGTKTFPLSVHAAPYPMTFLGFPFFEEWGTWLIERQGCILFHFAPPTSFVLRLDVVFYGPSLSGGIVLNFGETRYEVREETSMIEFLVSNPADCRSLWIEAPSAISPAAYLNDPMQDARAMSIGIKTISISKVKA